MKRSALVLVLLLLAACGGKTEETEGPAPQTEVTTSPSGENGGNQGDGGKKDDDKKPKDDDRPAGEEESPDDSATGDVGDDGAGDGGDDDGDKTGGDGGGDPVARAPSPVDAGTYEYDTDGQIQLSGGSPRDMPETTTLTASAPSGEEQRTVRDLRDDDGTGQVTETVLHYRDDGVYLSYVKVTFNFPGGITDVREFSASPPELVAAAGAEPGDKLSFTMRGSGTTARVTVEALRTEVVEVDGERIDSIVVETVFAFSGAVEGRQESTSWFDPGRLLALREEVQGRVQNGPIEAETEYTSQLTSLSPE